MLFDSLLSPILGIIDKVIPDPAAKAAAQLEVLKLQQSGEIDKINAQLSAIIAEAKSNDPFTSRARPSFMYVIYIFILAAIPMGFYHSADPQAAANVTLGVQAWLKAIPEDLYWLFGAGYLGYTGARTMDKRNK